MKLVQLYKQIKEENEGSVKVLVPRRSSEEREKNYRIATLKKVQEYIKNGSKGDLNLRDAPITSLPDNLTVGGDLFLYNTPITSLPDNLTVEGSIDLRNTPITSLPDNLTVGGFLALLHTPISRQYTREQITQMVPGVKGNIIS